MNVKSMRIDPIPNHYQSILTIVADDDSEHVATLGVSKPTPAPAGPLFTPEQQAFMNQAITAAVQAATKSAGNTGTTPPAA